MVSQWLTQSDFFLNFHLAPVYEAWQSHPMNHLPPQSQPGVSERKPPARGDLTASLLPVLPKWMPAEWRVSDGLTEYEEAMAWMDHRVAAIAKGEARECVWLLEHPPLYTAGTSAQAEDLTDPSRFPVFKTGRGGQYTYHGPGQRIAYVMLNLKARTADIRRYVAALEAWLIGTLDAMTIRGERREDRVGVWVKRPERGPAVEDKIAAIGVRVRHSVTLHGISLNVAPDLDDFAGIIPCGVRNHGVTSLEDLGHLVSMPEVDVMLRSEFEKHFGPTEQAHRAQG